MGVAELERGFALLLAHFDEVVGTETNPSEPDLAIRVGLDIEVD